MLFLNFILNFNSLLLVQCRPLKSKNEGTEKRINGLTRPISPKVDKLKRPPFFSIGQIK